MFSSILAAKWHMYTCPLLFPPLLHLIPFCHSISLPSLCYSSWINLSWGRSPYPPSSRKNVLQIRPGDYMTHHSVAFTSDCTSTMDRDPGVKKTTTTTTKKRHILPEKLPVKQRRQSKHYQRVYPFFRSERLKWVTRCVHCNIAVNIHKLIII